jgi:hypothetical protein
MIRVWMTCYHDIEFFHSYFPEVGKNLVTSVIRSGVNEEVLSPDWIRAESPWPTSIKWIVRSAFTKEQKEKHIRNNKMKEDL